MSHSIGSGVLAQHDELVLAWVASLAVSEQARDIEIQERHRQRYHRLITSEAWRQA